MTPTITSHTIVRNEDRYIWYALQSILPHVDRLLICDTGSTDHTAAIIKTIHSPKIVFEAKPALNRDQLVAVRQQQLDQTTTDWFLILDGDEVYWRGSIKALKAAAKTSHAYGFITPTINCIGDIFHYQDAAAGHYQFGSYHGHFAVRLINRRISGLHLGGAYPLEGYLDNHQRLITDYSDKLAFINAPYLHLTNLPRSTDSRQSVISRVKKHELGLKFSSDFNYPEVFSDHRPDLVPSPWQSQSPLDHAISFVATPLKKLKRRLLP